MLVIMIMRRAASLCEVVMEGADVVLAIAAGPDVLETVRLAVLLLNHLPEVLGTIVDLARLVDALLALLTAGAAASQAAQVAREARGAAPEVAADLAEGAGGLTAGQLRLLLLLLLLRGVVADAGRQRRDAHHVIGR